MSCRRIIWLTCLCIPSVTLPRTEVASTTIDTCSKTAQDKHVGETVPRTKLSCMYTYKYIYIHRERENEYIYIIIYNSINNIKYYTIYKHTRILFKKVKRNIAEICWIQRSTASTRQMLLMLQTQKVSPLSIAFHQRVTGVWSTPSTSPVMYTSKPWFQNDFNTCSVLPSPSSIQIGLQSCSLRAPLLPVARLHHEGVFWPSLNCE